MQNEAPVRQVIPGFRWLLGPFAVLAAGAVLALFVASTRTDDFFAWTIDPPLTAALLGSAYAGALTLFVLALRERVWANVRIAVGPPFVLSVLTLIATLLHDDRFHLDADALPAAIAWIWLVVYIVVPPALIVLVVLQLRAPGGDPPRSVPMRAWMFVVLVAYGVAGVAGGIALFVAPDDLAPHWPWAITPLTGRAIAAWLVGLGVAALQAVFERDLRRIRAGVVAFGVIGVAGLVAVARYAEDLRGGVSAWLTVSVLAVMVVLSIAAVSVERSEEPSRTAG